MDARKFLGGISLLAALALTACGGGGATSGGGEAASGGTTVQVAADVAAFVYQQTTLEAAANQPITVNFNNPAALEHNWVLVQPGQEQAVADAATAKNGDPTGITGVIAGGKPITNASETINVEAQPAGTYPYICTVPGHYAAGMKGTMTIK